MQHNSLHKALFAFEWAIMCIIMHFMGSGTLLKRIGAVVRGYRRDRGLTAKELAQKAALSLRFISQLEAGVANISILKLASVAESLEVELHQLLADATMAGKSIALLGLRGAGKSTVGPLLAKEENSRFIELDSLIEDKGGLTLTEIFSLHGEGYYRRLETACLRELLETKEKVVVALSGGVVNNIEAFERLKQECVTVWLRAGSEDYMRRVLEQGDFRPVTNRENAMAELEALVRVRAPFYGQATITVDTSLLSVTEVVSAIASLLE